MGFIGFGRKAGFVGGWVVGEFGFFGWAFGI